MDRDDLPVDDSIFREDSGKLEEFTDGQDPVALPSPSAGAAGQHIRAARAERYGRRCRVDAARACRRRLLVQRFHRIRENAPMDQGREARYRLER